MSKLVTPELKHHVEVTVEVVYRKSFELTLSDEEYRQLYDGDTAPLDAHNLYQQTIADAEPEETDYTVWDFDQARQVVNWR